jgi:tetratricopeptide (TPR) repeat protein
MQYDFNVLEQSASKLEDLGRHADAIKILLFMSDGDPSLDGGWLGWRLGKCYEALGDLNAASYWHGRAIEENPEIRLESATARERLLPLIGIDDLLIVTEPKLPPWP